MRTQTSPHTRQTTKSAPHSQAQLKRQQTQGRNLCKVHTLVVGLRYHNSVDQVLIVHSRPTKRLTTNLRSQNSHSFPAPQIPQRERTTPSEPNSLRQFPYRTSAVAPGTTYSIVSAKPRSIHCGQYRDAEPSPFIKFFISHIYFFHPHFLAHTFIMNLLVLPQSNSKVPYHYANHGTCLRSPTQWMA